jgi:hypothetical protein
MAETEMTAPAETPPRRPPPPASTDPPPEAAGAPQAAPDAPQAHDPEAHERSEEAKRYRLQLREAEARVAERDGIISALRARLDDVDRVEVERMAEQRGMVAPADLWTMTGLADLRADDGTLDVEKIRSSVDALLKERPHWKRPAADLGSGARRSAAESELGLSKLLKGRR